MKLYFAGDGYDHILLKHKCHVLKSYYHITATQRRNGEVKRIIGIPPEQKLIMDSGAFSAWSLGKDIDIKDYIDFCKKTDADYYSVFDVIGDPIKTLENQKKMEEAGVNPTPCFHYGEDFKFLKYYCENYDYVFLGGMVPISTPNLRKWLDVIFTKYPKQKFHGFGLTAMGLVNRYPWESVDSSSWIQGARVGTIISNQTNIHYEDLNKDNEKARAILELLKQRGFTKEEMQDYKKRNEFNCITYLELQNNHNPIFKIKQFDLNNFGFHNITQQATQKNKKGKQPKNAYSRIIDKYNFPWEDYKIYQCNSCKKEFKVSMDNKCWDEMYMDTFENGIYNWNERCTSCNSITPILINEVRKNEKIQLETN